MTQSYDAIEGEKITEQGYEFMVKEIDGHHIQYLEIIKKAPSEDEADTDFEMEK